MKFNKYNHIENTTYKNLVNDIATKVDSDIKYYITEKIHGMNLQVTLSNLDSVPFDKIFYWDTVTLRDYYPEVLNIGTRNDWTNEEYIVDTITNSNLVPHLIRMYLHLKENGTPIDSIICYGEFFGGAYPDVPKNNNAKRVQKGIYYSPDNHFLPFDIAICNGDTKEFMCGKDFLSYCEMFDIPTVPVLKTDCTFEDAINYNEHFESEVYKMYSLPKVENNIAEGIVIKCYNKEASIGSNRVILKKKDESFSERTHKAEKKEKTELPSNLASIYNKMLEYVTEARIVNVCSHYAQINHSMIGNLIKDMTVDVFTDYSTENTDFNALEKADKKVITKELNKSISKLVVGYVNNNAR